MYAVDPTTMCSDYPVALVNESSTRKHLEAFKRSSRLANGHVFDLFRAIGCPIPFPTSRPLRLLDPVPVSASASSPEAKALACGE